MTALRDGKTVTATVKLIAAPETPPRDAIRIKSRSPFEGALVENVSPAVSEELSLRETSTTASSSPRSRRIRWPPISAFRKATWCAKSTAPRSRSTRDLEAAASQRPRLWDLTIERGGQMIRTRIGG